MGTGNFLVTLRNGDNTLGILDISSHSEPVHILTNGYTGVCLHVPSDVFNRFQLRQSFHQNGNDSFLLSPPSICVYRLIERRLLNARTLLPGNYLATALAKSFLLGGFELQITVTNIVTAEVTTEVYVTVDVNDNECNAYQVAVSSDGVWHFFFHRLLLHVQNQFKHLNLPTDFVSAGNQANLWYLGHTWCNV